MDFLQRVCSHPRPTDSSSTMDWCYREPTLNGILSDSIVTAVMEADGVNPHELEVMLRRVAQRLKGKRSTGPRPR
jgi:hypothetical protein